MEEREGRLERGGGEEKRPGEGTSKGARRPGAVGTWRGGLGRSEGKRYGEGRLEGARQGEGNGEMGRGHRERAQEGGTVDGGKIWGGRIGEKEGGGSHPSSPSTHPFALPLAGARSEVHADA